MIKLKSGELERKFSKEHAENILNHAINKKVKEPWELLKDSEWKFSGGKLEKKKVK